MKLSRKSTELKRCMAIETLWNKKKIAPERHRRLKKFAAQIGEKSNTWTLWIYSPIFLLQLVETAKTAIYSNYFTKHYMFHSYNTRIKDSLHVDLFASSMGQRSIKYKGSTRVYGMVYLEKLNLLLLLLHLLINCTKSWCNYLQVVWLFVCWINFCPRITLALCTPTCTCALFYYVAFYI